MASALEQDEEGADRAQQAVRKLDSRWRFERIRTTGRPTEIRLTRSSASGVMFSVQDIGRNWAVLFAAARLIDHHFANRLGHVLKENSLEWLTPSPSPTRQTSPPKRGSSSRSRPPTS